MRSFESLFRVGIVTLFAALLLASAPARADGASILNGFYLALHGGFVELEDSDLD